MEKEKARKIASDKIEQILIHIASQFDKEDFSKHKASDIRLIKAQAEEVSYLLRKNLPASGRGRPKMNSSTKDWPENIYCVITKSESYENMPPDAEKTALHVLKRLTIFAREAHCFSCGRDSACMF